MEKTAPRKFARVFESAKFGQILMLATTDDDQDPCLQVTVDTHPDHLEPTTINLSFADGHDQYASLADFTLDRAEAFAKDIYKLANQAVPAPKDAP